MSLKGFYKTSVHTVSPNRKVTEAAEIMRDNHIGNVVVVDETNGRRIPIGLLTDRDIAISCVADNAARVQDMTVGEVMAPNPVCVKETQGVYETAQLMRREGVARLPVVGEDGSLIGIITSKNILALLNDELSEIVEISDSHREAGRRSKPAVSRLEQETQSHMQ